MDTTHLLVSAHGEHTIRNSEDPSKRNRGVRLPVCRPRPPATWREFVNDSLHARDENSPAGDQTSFG